MLSIPPLSCVIKKTITLLPIPHLGPPAAVAGAIWHHRVLYIINTLMSARRHVVHILTIHRLSSLNETCTRHAAITRRMYCRGVQRLYFLKLSEGIVSCNATGVLFTEWLYIKNGTTMKQKHRGSWDAKAVPLSVPAACRGRTENKQLSSFSFSLTASQLLNFPLRSYSKHRCKSYQGCKQTFTYNSRSCKWFILQFVVLQWHSSLSCILNSWI